MRKLDADARTMAHLAEQRNASPGKSIGADVVLPSDVAGANSDVAACGHGPQLADDLHDVGIGSEADCRR